MLRTSGSTPRSNSGTIPPNTITGLWILLVPNEGELSQEDADGRVPVMARAGNNQMYLLVFKDVAKARAFVTASKLEGAEPRMVVRGNYDDVLRIARSANAAGTLVDYNATTQAYSASTPLV